MTNFTLLTCSRLRSQFGLHLQLLDTWNQSTALPPPIKRMFDLRVFDRRSLNLLIGPPVPPSMTSWLLQEPEEKLLLVANVLLSQRVGAAGHAVWCSRKRTLLFLECWCLCLKSKFEHVETKWDHGPDVCKGVVPRFANVCSVVMADVPLNIAYLLASNPSNIPLCQEEKHCRSACPSC